MTDKTREKAGLIRRWRNDIVSFVREHFDVEPDLWQVRALRAFADGNKKIYRLSLQACAGPGKSALLSWCGWWFLSTQGERGSHPKAAAVSVTQDNLRDNLWAEMSKWQQRSGYLSNCFQWTKQRIFAISHPETWFMTARSFSRSANAEEQGRTLSGLHSKYVLFLIDESGDIPTTVLKACEQALSTADKEFGRVIQAGNPTSHDGMLYAAQGELSDDWDVISITGDPDDEERSPRIDIDWAKKQINTYGREDPWVMSYILGRFPKTSINTLLSPDEISQSMRRKAKYDDYFYAQKRLGIDVARFGCFDDKTEILTNSGWKLFTDLTGRELVLSSDVGSNSSEWKKIVEVHKYKFDGYLNEINTSKQNFCVTDNHKFPVRSNPTSNKYVLKKYEDLAKDFVVESTQQWSGESPDKIVFKSKKNMPNGGVFELIRDYKFNDWCEFLGWFVSEGNVYHEKRKSGRKRIIITQISVRKMNTIKKLLTRMGIKWRLCSNKKQVEFSNNLIGEHLDEHCGIKAHNKKIPIYVKDSSIESIKIFLNSFMLGDGSCKKDGSGVSYATSSVKLANDLQECLAKIGQFGLMRKKQSKGSKFYIEGREIERRHDVYVVYQVSKPRDRWFKKKMINKKKYKGYVYCISTEYKTMCVRRRGVVMWSGNSDANVIFPRQGLMAFRPVDMRGVRTHEIAARVAAAKAKWESDIELVDGTGGYGAGVVDSLIQAGFSPFEINFAGKATDPRFFNKRAEMWFKMAEWIRRGGCLPRHEKLAKELSAVTYTFRNGKFLIESKDQIKEKLGYSTDYSDALCLTFAIDEMPNSNTIEGVEMIRDKKPNFDYDPFSDDRS